MCACVGMWVGIYRRVCGLDPAHPSIMPKRREALEPTLRLVLVQDVIELILEYAATYRLYTCVHTHADDPLDMTWRSRGKNEWQETRQTSLMSRHTPHAMEVQLLFAKLSKGDLPNDVKARMIALNLVVQRQQFAFVVCGHVVYVLGGVERGTETASVLQVDLRTRSIEALPPLHRPMTTSDMPVAVHMPGKIVVIEPYGEINVLDRESRTWTHTEPSVGGYVHLQCGCRMDEQTVLAITEPGIAHCYSMRTATWSTMSPNLPGAFTSVNGCVALRDGSTIYAFGQQQQGPQGDPACVQYKPGRPAWDYKHWTTAPVPDDRALPLLCSHAW
jgi:hypothetical protein